MASFSPVSYDIAKAGWLYRQTSILRRWKRNWFVLDRQGDLRFFESRDAPRAEERIVVRAVVVHIKTGPECRQVSPPEGLNPSKACFLELCMRDPSENMLLCAETIDDMRAWQISLDEARTIGTGTGPHNVVTNTTYVAPLPLTGSPYIGYGYPGHVISTGPTQVVHSPYGTTTTTVVNPVPHQQIVYVDNGHNYRHRNRHFRGGIYPAPIFFW